jgi:hypothetical protein
MHRDKLFQCLCVSLLLGAYKIYRATMLELAENQPCLMLTVIFSVT